MPYQAIVFNVMIASPGDVAAERMIVRDVIQDWNAAHSKSRGIVLQAIGWDSHSYPSMEDHPQGVLNKQILAEADLLIAVFWTRLGTPTKDEVSGTVEEIERHIKAARHAMIYFSDVPIPPSMINHEQHRQLQEFKDSCKPRGLLETYKSLDQFRDKLARQLAAAINDRPQFLAPKAKPNEPLPSVPVSRVNVEDSSLMSRRYKLSPEACELLVNAAEDQHGEIQKTDTVGGVDIKTNGKNFVPKGNARARAIMENALTQLWTSGCVELTNTVNVYRVTFAGYQIADQLKQKATGS